MVIIVIWIFWWNSGMMLVYPVWNRKIWDSHGRMPLNVSKWVYSSDRQQKTSGTRSHSAIQKNSFTEIQTLVYKYWVLESFSVFGPIMIHWKNWLNISSSTRLSTCTQDKNLYWETLSESRTLVYKYCVLKLFSVFWSQCDARKKIY